MDVYPSYMNGIKVSLTRIFAPESHAFPQTCLGFRSHPPCDSNDSIPAHPVVASDLYV
ncbi:hypothetical protein L210DRAFT_954106 [Boletus edulis BED1]|uniref:Uncharacterized protein n=1 Tax=Boletus edulis BED1 TaxID=1328754 RepID=A0AAD4C9C8_BOLED|nr:hypothetical protein L210DRAFT_954106 [Boletus edulis BED1]